MARTWWFPVMAGLWLASACSQDQDLYERAKAAQAAGQADEAVKLYDQYLKEYPDGTAVDDIKLRLGASVVMGLEQVLKNGDTDAGYKKLMEVEGGPYSQYVESRLTALKLSNPVLKAIVSYKTGEGSSDAVEAALAMIDVAESGTQLVEPARKWLHENAATAFLDDCIGPAANAARLPDLDIVELAQGYCDHLIKYTPDTDAGKKAKAAKEGPLQARWNQLDTQYKAEIAKEKAKAAKAKK